MKYARAILKGKLEEYIGDPLTNEEDEEKYSYILETNHISDFEDVLEIPIYSNGFKRRLAFPPVGINILGSGTHVAKFRSSYFDADIRGNDFVDVAESIDRLLTEVLALKKQVREELPECIIKTIVTLLFESEYAKFKNTLIKVASSYKSQKFFEEFEEKYKENTENTKEHLVLNDLKIFITALAWLDEKNITPKIKQDAIDDVFKKSEALVKSLTKWGNDPNVYDLIGLSIQSPLTNSLRKSELLEISKKLLGRGWNQNFPTLKELLNGYMSSLENIDVESQNRISHAFSFNEESKTSFLADFILRGDFDTTDVRVRYDRRVFTLCETLFEEIPSSLSRIFDLVFNNGRSFDNSKKAYRKWKKEKEMDASKKLE